MAETVCFVVGARPNFVKTAPVIRALRRLEPSLGTLLVHTGQHYDAELSGILLEDLGLPTPDVVLEAGSGTHAEQTARALVGVERALLEHRPACVVVSGDVNSTLAAALAAVKLGIPVAHLEAGLRSFDDSMPEEHNRRLTDHLSSLLLAHSESAVENLEREGIDLATVHLVGNTMIDSLLEHADRAWANEPWRQHGLYPGGYGLVTLHRPTLVDDPELLREAVERLADLSAELPLLFPAHPRTARRLEELGPLPPGSRLIVTPPLGYLAFLGLEAAARFVLTDSGGVQEETSALGIPCFTLRETTERPVTVELGTNTVLGLRPERIAEIRALLDRPKPAQPIPLWDGRAAERAAQAIAVFVRGPAVPVPAA
jgi:UDP-N-acetylglucosamine 2-epimerase (non-hydrolysing)